MNLRKYSWLAALPLFFTACQEDVLVEEHAQRGIYTLSASMDGSADSRAQIVLNGTSTVKESFHWNEGDAFTLYQLPIKDAAGNVVTNYSSHEFTISDSYSDEKPAASADFSTLDGLTVKRDFVAFYPSPVVDAANPNKVSWVLEHNLPDNTEASWKNYFKKNMFMMVRGSVSETNALAFEHMIGIIRVTYKNTSAEDRTIKRLLLTKAKRTIGLSFDLSRNGDLIGGRGDEGNVGITFDNAATVAAGASENFYILFVKNLFDNIGMAPFSQIQMVTSDGTSLLTPEYSKELPTMDAGKCYWYNVTDNGKELFWTNDQQGGEDEGDKDFVEKQVSTYAELKAALSTHANQLVVLLKNDIKLEAPLMTVSPTDLDLCGHALSLSDNYASNGSTAVFDVQARLGIHCGSIVGKDGAKLHDYFFNLTGQYASLVLGGVTLNTGTAIANGVYMDDDQIRMSTSWRSNGSSQIEYPSSIVTSGDAIHHVSNNSSRRYISRLEGDITGNIYVESQYEGLNVELIFMLGNINGNLDCTNVNGNIVISDYIRKAGKVTIGSGYTGWDKAGLYVEDQRYDVSTFEQLKKAVETPQALDEFTQINLRNDITLESPLTLTKPTIIHGKYTLVMSDSFDWGSSADAAIMVQGNDAHEDYLNLNELTMVGASTPTGKYLIKTSKAGLHLNNVTLHANGVANAIHVEDANTDFENATSITAGKDGYALYMSANTRYAQAHIFTTGTITGNVGFNANVVTDRYPNIVVLQTGTVNGDFSATGTCADNVEVRVEAAVVNGKGWNEATFGKMQKQFTEEGGTHTDMLTLTGGQVVEFVVGTTHEGIVHFDVNRLGGSGTVKFVNKGDSTVIVDVYVGRLDDGVKFEFEGNIRKRFQAHTTRIKEFFEMGKGSDQIVLWLSSDVTLKEQIVVGSDRVWARNENMGENLLVMDNHTLNIELDKPAFVVQGGMFAIDGGPNNAVGTINTTGEFVQIGAGADTGNNTVELNITGTIKVNSGTDSWVSVKAVEENLSAHKNVYVHLSGQAISDELKKKVNKATGYKGTVEVNGEEI